jgi:hypothetical protein
MPSPREALKAIFLLAVKGLVYAKAHTSGDDSPGGRKPPSRFLNMPKY